METGRLVITTCPTKEQAQTIAHSLLNKRLIACANVLPGAQSLYHWEGRVADESEVVILMKTTAEKLAALEREIVAIHPYRVPEFIVLEIAKVGEAYARWLQAVLAPQPSPQQPSQ